MTTLLSFDGPNGSYPQGALVQGADGNSYGTTTNGGNLSECGGGGCGTVFKISSAGEFTTLYSFCSLANCADGEFPIGALIQATDGNFYGTTTAGGTSSNSNCSSVTCGTVFQITPAGKLTTLHSFNYTDGTSPYDGVMQATNGVFYGTTSLGGPGNTTSGTIFSLSMGLSPFVEPLPAFGKEGVTIDILGTDLKGTTAVSFDGTAATFKVVSKTEIRATVPSGAKTGKIEVTTPNGTLKSNVAFQVL